MVETVQRLNVNWGPQLAQVYFVVEEVPAAPAPWERSGVALGRSIPADGGQPARVVLYRRPIETRCESRAMLRAVVAEVLVEQVAQLLGVDPERLDPGRRG